MGMEVHFTADQEAFIRQAIDSGRYQTADDAVRDAMARWEEDERARLGLLAAFDEAESDLETEDFVDYTDANLDSLAMELKREGRNIRDRG